MSTPPDPFRNPAAGNQPRVVYVPMRRRRRVRRRFRASLVLVPLTLAALMWLAQGVRAPISWHGFITGVLQVKNTERYTMLATLAVILVALAAITRICRGEKEDSE